MRQGQKSFSGRGIKKVFPAPVSSSPPPKVPVRAGALQSSPELHFILWVSFHPPELLTPALQQSKIPFWERRHPRLLQCQEKRDTRPLLQGNPAFAQPPHSPPRARGAEQEQRDSQNFSHSCLKGASPGMGSLALPVNPGIPNCSDTSALRIFLPSQNGLGEGT